MCALDNQAMITAGGHCLLRTDEAKNTTRNHSQLTDKDFHSCSCLPIYEHVISSPEFQYWCTYNAAEHVHRFTLTITPPKRRPADAVRVASGHKYRLHFTKLNVYSSRSLHQFNLGTKFTNARKHRWFSATVCV